MNAASTGTELRAFRVEVTRFVALTVALSFATGVGLWLTQGAWSLSSTTVFVPLALAGVLLIAILARSASAPAKEMHAAKAPPPTPEVSSSVPVPNSVPLDANDEVDYLMALRHEFRTPLNAVLGFSDVLLGGIDGAVNESQQEDLEIIRASGIKLRILLDSALDLSQLAAGDLKPGVEPVDAREVVQRAKSEALQLWAGKRTASVSVSDEPCLVATDEARLRRCILVLADFLAMDHREASIEIALDLSEEYVSVSVAASSSERLALDALPTSAEVLASEDPTRIRRWPVAVTSEVIALHGGSLYHGDSPARFVIRLPWAGPS